MKTKVINLLDYREKLLPLTMVYEADWSGSFLSDALLFLEEPTEAVILTNIFGKIIGWGLITNRLSPFGWSGMRYPGISVYVCPEHRGRGAAVKIVSKLVDRFAETSPKNKRIAFDEASPETRMFYQKTFIRINQDAGRQKIRFKKAKTLIGWSVIEVDNAAREYLSAGGNKKCWKQLSFFLSVLSQAGLFATKMFSRKRKSYPSSPESNQNSD